MYIMSYLHYSLHELVTLAEHRESSVVSREVRDALETGEGRKRERERERFHHQQLLIWCVGDSLDSLAQDHSAAVIQHFLRYMVGRTHS